MIIGLAKGVYQGIIDLFKGGTQKVLEAQTNEISQSAKNQNALTEAVEETAKAQKGALAGFDEINTLSKDTAESQELFGGVGAVGAGIPAQVRKYEFAAEIACDIQVVEVSGRIVSLLVGVAHIHNQRTSGGNSGSVLGSVKNKPGIEARLPVVI